MYQLVDMMSLPRTGSDGRCTWYGTANCLNLDLTDASLRELHGSFAIVSETEDAVSLACDFIRSIPIAYAVANGEIAVSNDGLAVAKRFNLKPDSSACVDYLHASFTTGSQTLFHGMYTVLPGELVRISKADGAVSRHFYWELKYTCDSSASVPELIEEFDDCLAQVFRDLIDRLDGRTALLPLSGGCDSRTVAVTLKRLGYENVVCFSYGRRTGNSDARISQIVAKGLDYPWEFVEYNADVWAELYRAEDYYPYLAYASCANSMGSARSYPAMRSLADKYRDSIVIPGHALDFNMGSHIPAAWTDSNATISKAEYARAITWHYKLRHHPERCNMNAWLKNVPETMNLLEAVQWVHRFEWIHRQSKFIANEVRKYEFLGYAGWELPFWDRRICEFAAKLPIELLRNRNFQYQYMTEKIDPIAGIHKDYTTPPQKKLA